MKQNTRTENAIKNTRITILCHIVFLVCSFICRTVLTKKLGAEYLGIGGLFSNILTILSFAELGLGSTLVYRLYKPFTNNDYEKISLYVKLYKKIYNIIIIIIFGAGLLLIPFLKYLVVAPNVKENLVLLYLLYLSQTLASYLFVYKKTLLTADQKDYIVSLFNETFNVIMNIFQCFILIFFQNYIWYLVISIVCIILNNFFCSIYVDKKYKFLKNEVKGSLNKEEINDLKKDTKGLLMTKVASTAFSGTDNIFISSFIGIEYVGILSNYTLILTTVNGLINKIFSSITASVGNLIVSKNSEEKAESVLFKMFFINASLYTYICNGLLLLITEFVTKYWLNNDYFLASPIVVLSILELYFRAIHYPIYITRNAYGLFSQYRIIFVIAAILNIFLDFILVKPLGIAGLIIATIFCRGITAFTDIYVLYRYGFKKKIDNYILKIVKWFLFFGLCYIISYSLFTVITKMNFFLFIVKIVIFTIIYVIIFWLYFHNCDEFKYCISLIKNRIKKN